jgi:hypothetical protein
VVYQHIFCLGRSVCDILANLMGFRINYLIRANFVTQIENDFAFT